MKWLLRNSKYNENFKGFHHKGFCERFSLCPMNLSLSPKLFDHSGTDLDLKSLSKILNNCLLEMPLRNAL